MMAILLLSVRTLRQGLRSDTEALCLKLRLELGMNGDHCCRCSQASQFPLRLYQGLEARRPQPQKACPCCQAHATCTGTWRYCRVSAYAVTCSLCLVQLQQHLSRSATTLEGQGSSQL